MVNGGSSSADAGVASDAEAHADGEKTAAAVEIGKVRSLIYVCL